VIWKPKKLNLKPTSVRGRFLIRKIRTQGEDLKILEERDCK